LEDNEEVPNVIFEDLDFKSGNLMDILSKHKFDSSRRSLFILEDVVSHLNPDEVWKLFM